MPLEQEAQTLPAGQGEFKATVANSQQHRWCLRGFGTALEIRKPRGPLND